MISPSIANGRKFNAVYNQPLTLIQNTHTMQTLDLEKPTALKLYKLGGQEIKDLLISKYGTELFCAKIIDRVTSYEDAYELADKQTREECKIYPATDSPDIVAYKKLKLVIKVINEDWIADYNNPNQKKYYAWFRVLPSGSGFDFSPSCYGYDDSGTAVGVHLCFETREKCEYVAKQFTQLYEAFLLTK